MFFIYYVILCCFACKHSHIANRYVVSIFKDTNRNRIIFGYGQLQTTFSSAQVAVFHLSKALKNQSDERQNIRSIISCDGQPSVVPKEQMKSDTVQDLLRDME